MLASNSMQFSPQYVDICNSVVWAFSKGVRTKENNLLNYTITGLLATMRPCVISRGLLESL